MANEGGMVKRVEAIVGPTATGKTARALARAREVLATRVASGVDLISADSRQVYQGLEILTGADVPPSFQLHQEVALPYPYYEAEAEQVRLHGISIISPAQAWSLAHFRSFAREVIKQSWQASRLPIVVGGTGLYHRWLWHEGVGFGVAPNQEVREKARLLTVAELQAWLAEVAPERLAQMNDSDQANPRRLVRALEVALARTTPISLDQAPLALEVEEARRTRAEPDWSAVRPHIHFLALPLAELEKKISARVMARFQAGAVEEVRRLQQASFPSHSPALSTLGVAELSLYLAGEVSAEESQRLWALHEFQYAKRQLTWWRRFGASPAPK